MLVRSIEKRLALERALITFAISVIIFFILIPLVTIVLQSISREPIIIKGISGFTYHNYVEMVDSPLFWRSMVNSMIISAGSLAMTLTLGSIMAFLIVRTNIPFSGIIHRLIYMPIFLGPLLLAFGWVELASPRGFIGTLLRSYGIDLNVLSIWGIIYVTSLWLTPYAYTFIAAGLRSVSSELELSARISGASFVKAFTRVVLPLLGPFILSSSYLIFVLSFEQFSIPMVLGYSEGIFTLITYLLVLKDISIPPPYGVMASLGMLTTAIIGVFIVANAVAMRRAYRLITVTGRGQYMRPIDLGLFRWAALLIPISYILLSSIVPTAAIIYRAIRDPGGGISLANYGELFLGGMDVARRAILNSVVLAVGAAAVSVILSIIISYARLWRVMGFSKLFDWIFWIPIAMPGLVLGIGYLWGFLTLKLLFLYGSLLGLAIAYITRFITTGVRMASSIASQISPDLDYQAAICGATIFTRLRRIIMPIGKVGFMGVYAILVATYINEISTSLYLVGPGSEVSSVVMLQLWQHGFMDLLFAMASFQAIVVFIITYIIIGVLKVEPSISVGGIK